MLSSILLIFIDKYFTDINVLTNNLHLSLIYMVTYYLYVFSFTRSYITGPKNISFDGFLLKYINGTKVFITLYYILHPCLH